MPPIDWKLLNDICLLDHPHPAVSVHPDLHHGQGGVEALNHNPDVEVPGDQQQVHCEHDQVERVQLRKCLRSDEVCYYDHERGGDDNHDDLEKVGDKDWKKELLDALPGSDNHANIRDDKEDKPTPVSMLEQNPWSSQEDQMEENVDEAKSWDAWNTAKCESE